MDLVMFHEEHNLSFDRNDHFWTQQLSMFYAANKPQNERVLKPIEFVPWAKEDDHWPSPQELRKKLGF
jgi:hypothetical protein